MRSVMFMNIPNKKKIKITEYIKYVSDHCNWKITTKIIKRVIMVPKHTVTSTVSILSSKYYYGRGVTIHFEKLRTLNEFGTKSRHLIFFQSELISPILMHFEKKSSYFLRYFKRISMVFYIVK